MSSLPRRNMAAILASLKAVSCIRTRSLGLTRSSFSMQMLPSRPIEEANFRPNETTPMQKTLLKLGKFYRGKSVGIQFYMHCICSNLWSVIDVLVNNNNNNIDIYIVPKSTSNQMFMGTLHRTAYVL